MFEFLADEVVEMTDAEVDARAIEIARELEESIKNADPVITAMIDALNA